MKEKFSIEVCRCGGASRSFDNKDKEGITLTGLGLESRAAPQAGGKDPGGPTTTSPENTGSKVLNWRRGVVLQGLNQQEGQT